MLITRWNSAWVSGPKTSVGASLEIASTPGGKASCVMKIISAWREVCMRVAKSTICCGRSKFASSTTKQRELGACQLPKLLAERYVVHGSTDPRHNKTSPVLRTAILLHNG